MASLGVIIPIYNVEQYLEECLDSIAKQTYKDFIAVLVDDGSRDRSGDICDRYAESDSRFIVMHQANAGASASRNTGLDYLSARDDITYLSFIDSDDYIDIRMFEIMIASIEQTGADLSVCTYLRCASGQNFGGGYGIQCKESSVFDAELVYWFFPHITKTKQENIPFYEINPAVTNKIYKREIVGDIRFQTDIHFGEDHLFNLQVLCNASGISFCKEDLYRYRLDRQESLGRGKKDYDWLSYIMAKRRIDLYINNRYESYAMDGYIIHVLNCLKKYAKKQNRERYESIRRDYRDYEAIYCKYKREIKGKYRRELFFCKHFPRIYYFVFNIYERCFQGLRAIKRKVIRKKEH